MLYKQQNTASIWRFRSFFLPTSLSVSNNHIPSPNSRKSNINVEALRKYIDIMLVDELLQKMDMPNITDINKFLHLHVFGGKRS